MKISSRVDYALSCIVYVAQFYESKKPVTVKAVAEHECLDSDYVEQLLIHLRKAGILKSIRGAKGGYVLRRAPHDIHALEIIRAFDKEILELVCYRKKGRKQPCVHLDECNIRSFWLGLGKTIETYLNEKTLYDLVLLRSKENR